MRSDQEWEWDCIAFDLKERALDRRLRRIEWIQWLVPRVVLSVMAVLVALISEGWTK